MIIFGDRAFKEVLKVKWGHKGSLSFIRRERHWEDMCPEGRSSEGHDQVAISGQGGPFHKKPALPVPWFWTSSSSELWETDFWCLNYLKRVYGTFYGSPSRLRCPASKYFCHFYWDHVNVQIQFRENLDLKCLVFL